MVKISLCLLFLVLLSKTVQFPDELTIMRGMHMVMGGGANILSFHQLLNIPSISLHKNNIVNIQMQIHISSSIYQLYPCTTIYFSIYK